MRLQEIRELIPATDQEMLPLPDLFLHRSTLHGQAHVGRGMVQFAEQLFEETDGRHPPGSDHFTWLWRCALALSNRESGTMPVRRTV
jgi:hypothetical protein